MATTLTTLANINDPVYAQNREQRIKGTGYQHLGSIRKDDNTVWEHLYDTKNDIILQVQVAASTAGAGPV